MGNLGIKCADNKLNLSEIKRNTQVFSYICAIFVFLIGGLIAFEFIGINDSIAALILCAFLLFSIFIENLIFTIGIDRLKRKKPELLKDVFVVKWGFKKIIGISSLTILSSSLFFVIFVLTLVPNVDIVQADNLILGAHRGESVLYIENTLPAFENALENDSYKFIEFDVQYTLDNVSVVHHDMTLFRFQKKIVYIEDVTYEELLEISDYHIPTYFEVMELIAGKKSLNIEIKSQGNLAEDKNLVDEIMADCRERGIYNKTLYSSPSSDVLIYIREKYPEVKTGKVYWVDSSTFANFEIVTQGFYDELELVGADYLIIYASNLRNYHILEKIRPIDKTIMIWYLNNQIYLIPSGEKTILDDSGNILGYVIKKNLRKDISRKFSF